MELQNYYTLLMVETTADINTIKAAFRREIALYHPDNNTSEDAKAHFDLLVEGFDILSNSKKREAYDKLLLSSKPNVPVVIPPKAETEFKAWKKESKKKANSYWDTALTELLVLDIFLETGLLGGLLSGTEDLFDGIGDSLGDIFDIF